jgi:hypothetical protein
MEPHAWEPCDPAPAARREVLNAGQFRSLVAHESSSHSRFPPKTLYHGVSIDGEMTENTNRKQP